MKDNELIEDWKKRRNFQSYNMLKNRHRGMVMLFVNKYAASGVPRGTLEMEAWKHFDDSVSSYDPKKAASFGTHLNYNLRKLDRYTKKYQNVGRIPENLSRRIGEYDRAHSNLSTKLKRKPTAKEISKEMGWGISNVKNLEKSRRDDLFEGGFEATGFDVTRKPEDANAVLMAVREELSVKEKEVFDYLIGYKKPKIKNKQQLAKKLGISSGRLSQITRSIAIKIRPHLSRSHGVGIVHDN